MSIIGRSSTSGARTCHQLGKMTESLVENDVAVFWDALLELLLQIPAAVLVLAQRGDLALEDPRDTARGQKVRRRQRGVRELLRVERVAVRVGVAAGDERDARLDELQEQDAAEMWGPHMSYGWRLETLAPWKSILLLEKDGFDPFASLRGPHVSVSDRPLVDGLIRFLEVASITLS